MSRSVELPDSVYDALEAVASASGTTPAGWIAAKLPSTTDTPPEPEPASDETLEDGFEDYIGLFNSGRGDLAERHSELFLEGLLEKRRTGTL